MFLAKRFKRLSKICPTLDLNDFSRKALGGEITVNPEARPIPRVIVHPATVVSCLAVIAALVVLMPSTRIYLRHLLFTDTRQILSTVSGDVFGDGSAAKILKVETSEGIFLEIYQMASEFEPTLYQRIKLQDKSDGHFVLNGESSNLILNDVDKDSRIDILAPSFDRNLKAHLNVFTFNADQSRFVELN